MATADLELNHFLVIYDIAAGEAEVKPFGNDYEAAVEAYTELETQCRGRDDLDIVLLGADSLETIKKTHSSYFATREGGFEQLFPPEIVLT